MVMPSNGLKVSYFPEFIFQFLLRIDIAEDDAGILTTYNFIESGIESLLLFTVLQRQLCHQSSWVRAQALS